MTEENIGQEFKLKHRKVYRILNYTEHLLTLASAVTECVSIMFLLL